MDKTIENNSILFHLQQELVAPKNQYNHLMKYKYRSCEDILVSLKPLLEKTRTTLLFKDSVEAVGQRNYVKATAILYDTNGKVLAETYGFAREQESKKGMDESQITGAASSYARKYALNAMFLINDVNDADAYDNSKEGASADKASSEKNHVANDTPASQMLPMNIIKQVEAATNVEELTRLWNNYEKLYDHTTLRQLLRKRKVALAMESSIEK